MSNIKVILIIFINIFVISLSFIRDYNGSKYFAIICSLLGIFNYKYVFLNTKLTNKQRFIAQLFIITTVILALLYISYSM